jgi:CDP-ribitol ribitolphosphotransferase
MCAIISIIMIIMIHGHIGRNDAGGKGVAGMGTKNTIQSAYSAVRSAYKDTSLKKLYPSRYLAAAKRPVRPGYVVFLEVREKDLTDNFRLIRAALERRSRESGENGEKAEGTQGSYSFDTVCIREGMENPASVTLRCLAAIPKIARAEYVFVNESSYFLSSLPLRPETTVIQTWHACGAFKKFGYSAVGKGFGTTEADLEKYPVHKNFSYVTVSSEEVVWAYAEAFHMEDRVQDILPIGVSRTDLYFHSKVRRNAALRVRHVLEDRNPSLRDEPAPACLISANGSFGKKGGAMPRDCERVFEKKKLLLYAPTYRGSVREAASPDQLNILRLKEELGDGYLLLIRQHPFVRKKAVIPKGAEGFAMDVSDLRIEDLIIASDMLITDYSSIVFEYSLFEKPMVFFAFDLEDYEKQRGFYYPVREMMPGPICHSTHDVAREIRRMETGFDWLRVREFKYRFMGGCDGHATERILRLMDAVREKKKRA